MDEEIWLLTLRAQRATVSVRSRINALLKYAARLGLRCIRLGPPDSAAALRAEIALLTTRLAYLEGGKGD